MSTAGRFKGGAAAMVAQTYETCISIMKRKGIAVLFFLVLFSVLLIVNCGLAPDDSNHFEGTWLSSEGYIAIFEESTWYIPEYSNRLGLMGTYTYVRNSASIIYTEITEDGIIWRAITPAEASLYTRIATVSGNKLTWGATTYTRQR